MLKPERLGAFCDGVIAVSITLLVLGIEVPSTHEVPEKELPTYLFESLLSIHGYVISFLLIGTYWAQHFVIFHYVKSVDRMFLCLNGVFLLCVSFVSFPTGLQVAYKDDELAMILYAATHACCGLSLVAIWAYATKNRRLIGPRVSNEVIHAMRRRLWNTPILCVLAMATSFISLNVSRIVFVGIPLSYRSHKRVDEGWVESDESSSPQA